MLAPAFPSQEQSIYESNYKNATKPAHLLCSQSREAGVGISIVGG